MDEKDNKQDDNSKSYNELVQINKPKKFSFKPSALKEVENKEERSVKRSSGNSSSRDKSSKNRYSSKYSSSDIGRNSRDRSKDRNSSSNKIRKLNYNPPDYLKLNSVLGPYKKFQNFPLELTKEYSVYLDTKGNQNYHQYGDQYQNYKLSSYKREGYGKILGLSNQFRISSSRSKVTNKLVVIDNGSKGGSEITRYMNSDHTQLDYSYLLKRLTSNPTTDSSSSNIDLNSDFIEFPSIIDSSTNNNNELEIELESIKNSYIRETIKQIEIKLTQNPQDIPTWLNYIKFSQNHYKEIQGNKPNKKNLVEIRISMLERAISKNLNNLELLLDYLDCCEEIMEFNQLNNKWLSVLEDHSKVYSLWLNYLNFLQSNFSNFTIQKLLDAYKLGINKLTNLKGGAGDDKEVYEIEFNLIKIIIKLVELLKLSGFSNLSISIIQSIIEFNWYLPPEYLNLSFSHKLQNFENFWDLEWPRFGEDNGTGWNTYYNLDGSPIYEQLPLNNNKDNIDDNDILEWCKFERELEIRELFPIKSNQLNENDEDIYKVILFEDLKPFLIELTNSSLKEILFNLILQLIGLPSNLQYSSNHELNFNNLTYNSNKGFYMNYFKEGEYSSGDEINDILKTFDRNWIEEESVKLKDSKFKGICNSPGTIINWFSNGDNSNDGFNLEDFNDDKVKFIRNCLTRIKSLSISNPDFYLILELKLEVLLNPENYNKLSKSLIKINPNNLELWVTYSKLVWSKDSVEKSREISKKIINLYWQSPNDFTHSITLIYFNWANLELEKGNWANVIGILLGFKNNSNPIEIGCDKEIISEESYSELNELLSVKINQHLINSKANRDSLAHLIHFLAILNYIKNNKNLDSIIKVYDYWINEMTITTTAKPSITDLQLEQIYTTYLNFIKLHIKQNNFIKSSLLTSIWLKAVTKFPKNLEFWEFLIDNELKFRVLNKLDGIVGKSLESNPSNIQLVLINIFKLLNFSTQVNFNGIKNQLSTILEDKEFKLNPILWILSIKLELNSRDKFENTKELIYKGINYCPWSKELYLFCLENLPNIEGSNNNEEELIKIRRMMYQKGLRFRANIN